MLGDTGQKLSMWNEHSQVFAFELVYQDLCELSVGLTEVEHEVVVDRSSILH